jgi:4-hydroxy-tetrahydrodipicolinate synthase
MLALQALNPNKVPKTRKKNRQWRQATPKDLRAMKNEFDGVWTAIVTPFTRDAAVDWTAFDRLMDRQANSGVTGVVVTGTTGESPTLSVQESLSLFRRAKANFGHKIKIMAGVGSNNTAQTVELARLAAESGVDCLLVVTPPYNKPTLAGLKAHYQAIADAQPKPICLYHVPGRTAQALSPEAITELAKIKNVTMVKEASADLGLFSRTVIQSPVTRILSGDDSTFLASMAVGGRGVISVVSNIFPEAWVALYRAFVSGDFKKALDIHNCLLPFVDSLFCESNPSPAKAILSQLGLCENAFRLPLVAVKPESFEKLKHGYQLTQTSLAGILK